MNAAKWFEVIRRNFLTECPGCFNRSPFLYEDGTEAKCQVCNGKGFVRPGYRHYWHCSV